MHALNGTRSPGAQSHFRDYRLHEKRLAATVARDAIESAEVDLLHGLTTSARIEMSAAKEAIIEGGRRDIGVLRKLIGKPPVFVIDAKLHEMRETVIPAYLVGAIKGANGVWRSVDRSTYIYPNDYWLAATDGVGQPEPGVGLTSLIRFLTGESLDVVVAKMARRFGLGLAK